MKYLILIADEIVFAGNDEDIALKQLVEMRKISDLAELYIKFE